MTFNMSLREKIKSVPQSPGIYQFLDDAGQILYVGKAKNLQSRLRQYFLRELGRGPAIEQMVRLASDIRFIETESEIEAVLLEADLINKLKPKYNIRLKDDKSFLVIKITKKIRNAKSKAQNGKSKCLNEINLFPSVELIRFKNVDLKDKTAEYFGPYPSGELLKKSLQFLRKIFPFRDCSKTKWRLQLRKNRPCIYGDIRVCSGPCNNWVNEAQYYQNIRYLKNFLRGRKGEIIKSLEREMKALSKAQHFERAALVRNKLAALNHLKDVAIGLRDDVFDPEKALFRRIECYDISNIGDNYVVGSMVVFTDGKSDKDEYRKFKIQKFHSVISSGNEKSHEHKDLSPFLPAAKGGQERGRDDSPSDLSCLKQVLERRFGNDWPRPDLIVIDGGPMQLRAAREVLEAAKIEIPLISISKGPERKKNDFHFSDSNLAKYFQNNLSLQNICIAARDEAHRFAIEYYRLLHRKDLFDK